MSGFDRYLRTMLDRAAAEARLDGSPSVEAQHLLLAIAADQPSATDQSGAAGQPSATDQSGAAGQLSATDQSGVAGRVLASAGLGHGAVRRALDREFGHSLAAAGVDRSAFGLPAATPDPHRVPALGASARLALERGMKAAGGRDPHPVQLLLGILGAEVGTVPRALALAGVDRAALLAAAEVALHAERGVPR